MSSASTSSGSPATGGALVLVATPIGNLGDMTFRGIEALKAADVIACEDTRHTQKLLNHFDIHTKTMSLHEHNEHDRIEQVVRRITEGETIAMVTDAGMPAISDPGEVIVAAVAEAGLTVTVIPGASAATSALAISGLSTERFVFEGFLPRKGVERKQRLAELALATKTTIIYESANRVEATARDLAEVSVANRRIVMVRELTKLHEEVWRGTLAELQVRAADDLKGEVVLVLEGVSAETPEVTDEAIIEALRTSIESGASKKDAVSNVAAHLSIARNRVYDLSLRT